MKLFYFNPHSYGMEAFICAESKEKAIECLLMSKPDTHPNYSESLQKDAEIWHNKKIQMMVNCTSGYTIDEFEPGQIVWSEIS